MSNADVASNDANNNPGETKNVEDAEKKNEDDKQQQKVEDSTIDIDDFIATILSVGTPGCALTETVKADTIVAFCAIARFVLVLLAIRNS